MSKPTNSLQAVLERQARDPGPEAPPAPTRTRTPRSVNSVGRKFFRQSREGKRLIAGHFEPKVAKQLKLLAVEEDTTVQALLAEAINLLLVKKGKKPITSVRV